MTVPVQRIRELADEWGFEATGQPMETPTSTICRVRYRDGQAILKISTQGEEQTGMQVLRWWAGGACARVYARAPDAILMEFVPGERSLAEMATHGDDDQATAILCSVIRRLHSVEPDARAPKVPSLVAWFQALTGLARAEPALIASGQYMARELLATSTENRILHGDIHHGNVLDGASRGWLAIDPKGLRGDPVFDYVNILRNPATGNPAGRARFRRQVDVIVACTGIDRTRLLEWCLAFSSLSAVWLRSDGDEPVLDLQIAALAAGELGGLSGGK